MIEMALVRAHYDTFNGWGGGGGGGKGAACTAVRLSGRSHLNRSPFPKQTWCLAVRHLEPVSLVSRTAPRRELAAASGTGWPHPGCAGRHCRKATAGKPGSERATGCGG